MGWGKGGWVDSKGGRGVGVFKQVRFLSEERLWLCPPPPTLPSPPLPPSYPPSFSSSVLPRYTEPLPLLSRHLQSPPPYPSNPPTPHHGPTPPPAPTDKGFGISLGKVASSEGGGGRVGEGGGAEVLSSRRVSLCLFEFVFICVRLFCFLPFFSLSVYRLSLSSPPCPLPLSLCRATKLVK